MDVIPAYLFVCRFLAQATDGRLDDSEWSSMVISLARHTRDLGYNAKDWQEAMDRSRDEYANLTLNGGPKAAVQRFRASVAKLQEFWNDQPAVLDALLAEFWRRARVDGVLDPMEEHFIAEVERAWLRRAPTVKASSR